MGKMYWNESENKRSLRRPLTATTAEDQRLWALVNEATLLKSGDEVQAVIEADRIVGLVRAGREHDEERQRHLRANERARARRRWKRRAWWSVGLATVLTVAYSLFWSLSWMEANDYAGFDQKFVNDEAWSVLTRWYGEERVPERTVLRSRQRSHFYTNSAWKVKFFLPGSKTVKDDIACVFLWDGNASEHTAGEYAVREGTNC